MTQTLKLILTYGFILAFGLASLARAELLPASEKEKIEALIKQVAHLNDAQFVRNGSAYSADRAATFLRLKWQANASEVSTARNFIDKVASFSGTSGQPYLIRFKDGVEIKSRDFLLAQLKKLET